MTKKVKTKDLTVGMIILHFRDGPNEISEIRCNIEKNSFTIVCSTGRIYSSENPEKFWDIEIK